MSRRPRDAYYSPDLCAATLVQQLPIKGLAIVLEPSVGGGSFVRAIKALSVPVVLHGCDINPLAPGLADCDVESVGDFLTWSLRPRPDWVIGNPPYSMAENHVRHALDITGRHVAFLLRLGFLESAKRLPFWRDHPCRHIWVLAERPSFTGDGRTDSCAYAFFHWDKTYEGPTTLDILSWRP